MTNATGVPHRTTPPFRPFGMLLDLFSSVWFGITLMVLIFFYMTIASAGFVYPIHPNIFTSDSWVYLLPRKLSWIDKTEMEIFAWWPFNLMLALLVANMTVVTLRRIRLTWLSAGVWMIHTGIIILTLGSVYYFGTKLEGDTPVFRRSIVLNVPGAASPERLIMRPSSEATVTGRDGTYHFTVSSIQPRWPLLSGEDKGKTACSVNVSITTPTQSFIRQMLVGYPQYTEDILPGQGRAVKVTGKKLLDEALDMQFAYEPQTEFYLRETAALYVRLAGQTNWIERPITELPHYSDHISNRSDVWQPAGGPIIEPKPLDIRVPAVHPDDPLADYDLHVTGRLHYAPRDESRWVAGGATFNPVASLGVTHGTQSGDVQLMALDPAGNTDDDGLIAFRWAESAQVVEELAAGVGSRMTIRVPGTDVAVTVSAGPESTMESNPDMPFQPLGETDWAFRIRHARERLQLGDGRSVPIASVEFKNAERTFRRWVTDQAEQAADVSEDGKSTVAADPGIEAIYEPGPMVLLLGGPQPDQLQWVVGNSKNRAPAAIGQTVEMGPSLAMTLKSYTPRARRDRRPVCVPRIARDPQAGDLFSRVRVSLTRNDYADQRWLAYHRYPLSSQQYAIPRRFLYQPTRYRLPDGRVVEMLFSRKRWPLPAALALEDFELKTHTGGFVPGATNSVRDFVSLLRAWRDGEWSTPFTTSLNKPAALGGMYYFQAEWDPGEMAYTGLGVGNRNGVYIQLFGCCLSVAGMIWVFYIKPIIKRRRRDSVWSAVGEQRSETVPETSTMVAAGESG